MSDFRDYPESVTERRGVNSALPDSWTPRDVLIRTLRSIDAGEIAPNHIMVLMAAPSQGTDFAYMQAGVLTPLAQLGLIERSKLLLVECAVNKEDMDI